MVPKFLKVATRFIGNLCRLGQWVKMPTIYFFRSPVSMYKPSYLHCPGAEPLFALTLGQLAQKAAEEWGEKEALVSVYEEQCYTFREVLEKVTCFLFVIFERYG